MTAPQLCLPSVSCSHSPPPFSYHFNYAFRIHTFPLSFLNPICTIIHSLFTFSCQAFQCHPDPVIGNLVRCSCPNLRLGTKSLEWRTILQHFNGISAHDHAKRLSAVVCGLRPIYQTIDTANRTSPTTIPRITVPLRDLYPPIPKHTDLSMPYVT